MKFILVPALQLIGSVLNSYSVFLIIYFIVHWLVVSGSINPYGMFALFVLRVAHVIVTPILDRMRRFLPYLGGLDISFLALIIIVKFVSLMVNYLILHSYF